MSYDGVFNETLYNNIDLCTTRTCPLDWASVDYVPSLGGNAFFLALFSACLFGQIVLGVYYRTWPFLVAWVFGEVLEVIGYVARVQMHNNVFASNPFLMYIITLTIAPAFLSAGVYLCFSRIIIVYGEELARFKPRTYTRIFICSDIFALILQAAGGALTDTADSGSSLQQTGINIMIAGLAFQVVSLTIYIVLCADFAWRVRKARRSSRETLRQVGCGQGRFHLFLFAIAAAVITIYVRSIFRVAELQGGFGSALANDEVTFMILEGAMVSIASLALTILHPGPIFRDFWKLAYARARLSGRSSPDGVPLETSVEPKGVTA